jgi:hypothetical protein
MGLSRLDNFLKSVRGNLIYVDPGSLDATDSIENMGNSLTRPFRTLQRALIEASRFSYQSGLTNDRFGKTTILLYPGEHTVDNRPGWIPDGSSTNYKLRSGVNSSDFLPLDLSSNFDVTNPNNQLYKFNSIYGGVIIPRGTSIVGLDLRKTVIRPTYVPNPVNDDITRSCVFRVTGACYFWQFTILDSNPNGQCYIDYTNNLFVPNFSHHKLSCFEYADGTNTIAIKDKFLTYSTDRTDLDVYYEKIGIAYGQASGRPISPDYPDPGVDIQPKIDEYRIVGPSGGSAGITSIRSGNGTSSSTTVTVSTIVPIPGLDIDTAIQVQGVSGEYDGKFVVSKRIDDYTVQYQVQNAPINPLPVVAAGTLSLTPDTVSSASPYIFNISLRSVYGMCGVLADGDKASGFKSMVIAQFTGIGLQKDDNAFIQYNESTGLYESGIPNLFANSKAVFKPSYQNFHIKTINDAYIQNVSVFAIGYAQHFSAESGGDQSINNSNSNFGAKSLVATGFKKTSFPQDDVGYITHIIPPQEIVETEIPISYLSIDVNTTIGVANTGRLYLYNQTNIKNLPPTVIQGYRIGARSNEQLNLLVSQGGSTNQYSARVIMPNTGGTSTQISAIKSHTVGRTSAGINSITSNNTLTFTSPHTFLNGESIRIIADNANLPVGLTPNTVYYAITSGLNNNQIQITKSLNDALSANNPITLYGNGGVLSVESRVSDKVSGDLGHPIQFDSNTNQWYINVSTASTENNIYSSIKNFGVSVFGYSTPKTFFNRKLDRINHLDKVYRVRYVIPSGGGIPFARPPLDGFIIQESNVTSGITTAEVQALYSSSPVTLSNTNQLRNPRFIANATWNGTYAYYATEIPHNLSIGSQVEITNIKTDTNPTATANVGFNGTFNVAGISSSKMFYVSMSNNPGTFVLSQTENRTPSLPTFKRKTLKGTLSVYRSQEVIKYIPNQQDGIYHLLITNSSNSPSVTPFNDQKFSQPIQNLYPQLNRDNPQSDPKASASFALSNPIGQVVINDPQFSLTKETLGMGLIDLGIGIGLTDIVSNTAGTSHTFYTKYDHGYAGITSVSFVSVASSGIGYGYGSATNLYNAQLVGFAGSTTGSYATARISVNATGNITSIKIIDGGSAYGIGNTLSIIGVATSPGFIPAVVKVDGIRTSVGECIELNGIVPATNDTYNTVYRITAVNSPKQVQVTSASAVASASTTGLGITATSYAFIINSGRSVNISELVYDNNSGIGTIATVQNHGFAVNNKITIGGADSSLYNGNFIVTKINSLTSLEVNIGISTSSPSTTGSLVIYDRSITSQAGTITVDNENISGRMIPEYAGITTTLLSAVNTSTIDEIQVPNTSLLDLNIGDCLLVDEEIVKIKTTVTSNTVKVFRGVYGTKASIHSAGSVVRRINLTPVELRRNSIIRASGHTFEYLGFGPGNYSTSLPSRQDRILSDQEQLLALSTKSDGGITVYTGMDDSGNFYVGNRKVNSATGQEKVFDTPIPTVVGEDPLGGVSVGFDALTPLEISVSRSIRVEGGGDKNLISQFDGPVIFNKKVSINSEEGVETNTLYIKGSSSISRQYTVGISTPSLSGNPGDVVYIANPSKGNNLGYVYTTDNDWYRVGGISLSKTSNINLFDKIGIGVTDPLDSILRVGSGSSVFVIDSNGSVGIGTLSQASFKLNIVGNTKITGGTLYTDYVAGDGSGLYNLNLEALGWGQDNTGVLYNTNSSKLVGIGTSTPRYNLELGSVGTSSTSLYVNGSSIFVDIVTTGNNLTVGGDLNSNSYNLLGGIGQIDASSIKTKTLGVSSSLYVSSSGVGIGTSTFRSYIDLEGRVRFKTYYETTSTLSISFNVVNIDLSQAQTFNLTVTDQINQFRILNPPTEATSFTIKITQGSTPYSVNIDNFVTSDGVTVVPVYWSGGGVLPVMTPVAGATDIYSFRIFNGSNLPSSGVYGSIVGQNFL